MEHNARNFSLQLGALVALYISISTLILLLFSVITIAYPDAAQYQWEVDDASSTIRATIAALVIFFPAYLILTHFVNKIRRAETGSYAPFTKWLLYLSLLVGGGVLLGDLVTILNSFLNGELTIRFLLKALVVLLVVGKAFTYYLLDARNYWHTHEAQAKRFGLGALVLVTIALILGFTHTESPTQVRERTIDERVVSDLQGIESGIQNYYQVHNSLPVSIDETYKGLTVPVAPTGRTAYSYATTSETTFKLCADFAVASPKTPDPYAAASDISWKHPAGQWCFEHAIPSEFMQKGVPLSVPVTAQ